MILEFTATFGHSFSVRAEVVYQEASEEASEASEIDELFRRNFRQTIVSFYWKTKPYLTHKLSKILQINCI